MQCLHECLNQVNWMSQDWRGCTSSLRIHPWLFVPVPNCSDTGEGTSKRDTQAYAYQATSSFKFFERSVRQRNCLTAVARQRFNGSSYHPIRCTFLVTLSIAGQRPAGRWLT